MGKKNKNYQCKLLPYNRIDCVSIQEAKQKVGWGVSAFNLPKTWENTKGEDVVIAVLDTGCDLDHPDLAANLLEGKNFVNAGSPPEDDNGHGCVSPETLVHTSFSGIDEIQSLYEKLNCAENVVYHQDGEYRIKDVNDLDIKTLSLDPKNAKTVISKIEFIQKLWVKNEIIKIILEDNIEFKLTPWHPAYLMGNKIDKKIIRKRADEICVGDYFIFPELTNSNDISTESLTDNLGLRQVVKIEVENYDGYFYDFTVKEWHNYIANGHFVSNTHVAGILVANDNEIGMVGVCPKAKVRPVKVLDKNGNGNLLNVAEGIKWAADQGVDLITMSLGAPIKVQQVRKSIQYAAEKGTITFCAAGNAGVTKEIFYPANYPESIAVGAIDEKFTRADFSNTGQNLDFMAPGVDIFSTVPDDWYATLSGTSMACPFAVGVTALLISYSKKGFFNFQVKTADQCRELLRKYTIPLSNVDIHNAHFYGGFGIIDPRKLYEAMSS